MPNPTMVTIDNKEIVVFTSYMSSNQVVADIFDQPRRCYYPSIFFFNLLEQKVHWQIEGAEIFIGIHDKNKVYYMTNQIWQIKDRSEYRNFLETGESRHSHFDDIVHMAIFGADLEDQSIIEERKSTLIR